MKTTIRRIASNLPSYLLLALAISWLATSSAGYQTLFLAEATARRESLREGLMAHEPIVIQGDVGFLKPPETSGVVRGTGTPEDPFIVEGWKIDASRAEPVELVFGRRIAAGVLIVGTTAHFVVRNVWVADGGLEKMGIWLEQVTGGLVQENTVTGNARGIGIVLSTGTVAKNNVVTNNTHGISVGGRGNVVQANMLRHNLRGIGFAGSNHTIKNNFIVDTRGISHLTGGGTAIEAGRHAAGNTIEANVIVRAERGIELPSDARENEISKNWITDTFIGIRLEESFNNTVTDNTVLDTMIGMHLVTLTHGTIITGNVFQDMEWYAMLFSTEGPANMVTDNTIKDSDRGIWILFSENITVERNKIVDSVFPIGVFCGSSGNTIGDNQLIDVENPPIISPNICFDPFPPPDLNF